MVVKRIHLGFLLQITFSHSPFRVWESSFRDSSRIWGRRICLEWFRWTSWWSYAVHLRESWEHKQCTKLTKYVLNETESGWVHRRSTRIFDISAFPDHSLSIQCLWKTYFTSLPFHSVLLLKLAVKDTTGYRNCLKRRNYSMRVRWKTLRCICKARCQLWLSGIISPNDTECFSLSM